MKPAYSDTPLGCHYMQKKRRVSLYADFTAQIEKQRVSLHTKQLEWFFLVLLHSVIYNTIFSVNGRFSNTKIVLIPLTPFLVLFDAFGVIFHGVFRGVKYKKTLCDIKTPSNNKKASIFIKTGPFLIWHNQNSNFRNLNSKNWIKFWT